MLNGKKILLIISGGIAAYKGLELIRLLRKSGAHVRCILTKGGAEFITPLSVASISENEVYTDLWSLKDETEMGHIKLSRECDLIVVAPTSANLIAKMAHGIADDLATTTLLASDKPIFICPAMNYKMWEHEATRANIETLKKRQIMQIGPTRGDMACGENGLGRMAEPESILERIIDFFHSNKPLSGYEALVTAGPTYESIDPVRFIGNHSSGKQGYAIAESLYEAGAKVTIISGPTSIPAPHGPNIIWVQSAEEMLEKSLEYIPKDIAVCTAAVSDWKPVQHNKQKIKKGKTAPILKLLENPDILKQISTHIKRPTLVIGFAAETNNHIENAQKKLEKKHCDWIIANDVSNQKTFGSDKNQVYVVNQNNVDKWSTDSKKAIAQKLIYRIIKHLDSKTKRKAA